MSRRLKRRLGREQDGRGVRSSPVHPARVQSQLERRLNRWLLVGGTGFAIGAVVLALLAPRFDPLALGVNLAGIGLGLLTGKVIGKFIFRRVLPTAGK